MIYIFIANFNQKIILYLVFEKNRCLILQDFKTEICVKTTSSIIIFPVLFVAPMKKTSVYLTNHGAHSLFIHTHSYIKQK